MEGENITMRHNTNLEIENQKVYDMSYNLRANKQVLWQNPEQF